MKASQAILCPTCGEEMTVEDFTGEHKEDTRATGMYPLQWERAGRPEPVRQRFTVVLRCHRHHRMPSVFDEYKEQP
jgi:hypothetical protein